MSQWHLFAVSGRCHPTVMRLPQSSGKPLFVRLTTIAILIAFTTMLPLAAQTALPQLSFSPTHLRFGTVIVGHSETQVVAMTNAGAASTTISAISVSSAEFSVPNLNLPLVLAAGQSVAVTVVFAPTTLGWTGDESITFENNSSDPGTQLVIAGVGVKSEPLTATPSSLDFGQVPLRTRAALSVVLTNGTSENQTLLAFWPQSPGFSVRGLQVPLTLTPGQSVTLSIGFLPLVAGVDGGSVFISGPSVDIPVTGTGTAIGQLTVAPAALNFGSVDVGTTTKQSLAVSATGGSVTISSAASSNSQFTIPGSSFPMTIAAGQSVTLDVDFSPTKSGTSSGKVTLASDASDTPSSESLTGAGVLPQYSVSLSWNSSTSSVSGYNVYRGTVAGTYSRINTTLDPSPAYVDTTVVSGSTYYYAATAVNSNREESAYSGPLKVVVP